MTVPSLGKIQMRIMKVLWERERLNAKEITDALNAIEPIAHSTVQTLLRKLEDKKAIAHDTEDRTFIYYALVKENEVTKNVTRNLIDQVFDGSVSGLVSYLLKHETIDRNEMDRLRQMIDEKEKNNE
jgi:BlaI family penicillinase repressor